MKILFITSTRLGDAVLSTGLLNNLLETYPQGRVTVACGPLPASLFEGFPNVEAVLALKKERCNGHWIKLWKRAVCTRWDMVVDLRNSAVSRLIRAKKRYIFGHHIDKSAHKVVQAANVMTLDKVPSPKLYFTKAQEEFADTLIPKGVCVLGIGPSANWIGKSWPPENYIKLIQWITGPGGPLPNARVAVFAAPGEESQARPVLSSVPAVRQIDGIAKGTPGEVAAALSRCALYVGNDSGLMHAAAGAGAPTVGLFGPSYPHLYAPWGEHTAYASTPETYDELTDFEGYSPETTKDSLMRSLTLTRVQEDISTFWNSLKKAA